MFTTDSSSGLIHSSASKPFSISQVIAAFIGLIAVLAGLLVYCKRKTKH